MATTLDHDLTRFTHVELQSMLLAGELHRYGIRGYRFYLPVGRMPTQRERAESLLPLMRPGRTLTGSTARWVHVGGTAPSRPEVSRRSGRTIKGDADIDCRYRRLQHRDITVVHGVVVTTPERTVRDLRDAGCDAEAERLISAIGADERHRENGPRPGAATAPR